jgi:hypothetical protein
MLKADRNDGEDLLIQLSSGIALGRRREEPARQSPDRARIILSNRLFLAIKISASLGE